MSRVRGRRTGFAAPFVIVLGCGQPDRVPQPPQPKPADAARPDVTPSDVVVEDAIASPPADARERTVEEWKDQERAHKVGVAACAKVTHPCNPPPPPPPLVLRAVVELDAEIAPGERAIDLRVDDGGFDLSLGWKATFVDEAGKQFPDVNVRITRRIIADTYRAVVRANQLPSKTLIITR